MLQVVRRVINPELPFSLCLTTDMHTRPCLLINFLINTWLAGETAPQPWLSHLNSWDSLQIKLRRYTQGAAVVLNRLQGINAAHIHNLTLTQMM